MRHGQPFWQFVIPSAGSTAPTGGPVTGADFSSADFSSSFLLGTYAVFDDTPYLLGTDDNDANNQFNYRIVLAPGAFASVPGNLTGQLEFRFGTLSASVVGAISSVWFGQMGASAPNFAGDQVQVKFSGGATMNSSPAGLVLSDVFTMAQPFDVTKSYVCAFFVNGANVSLATSPNDTNIALWSDHAAVGANQSALTVPTTASYSSVSSRLSFLEKIIL